MSVFCFYRHLSLKACGYVFRFRFSLEDKRGLSLGELIRQFCIKLWYRYLLHYGLLLHVLSQYLCLFSLILQGLHEEGECRQLEFWAGKEQILETYSAQLQKSWNSTEVIFGIDKKYWAKKILEGATHRPRGWGARPLPCGPLGGPPMPIFCYMRSFVREK